MSSVRERRTGLLAAWILLISIGPLTGAQGHAEVRFGNLPLHFVENRGLYADSVAYFVHGARRSVYFTPGGLTVSLRGKHRGWAVKVDFPGARADARPRGEAPRTAVFNYFDRDPSRERTGLRSYGRVTYPHLWPGIDLTYQGSPGQIKYSFTVRPGRSPAAIRLRYRGATSVRVLPSGVLRVETPEGVLEDPAPVAYQDIDGRRVPVTAAFSVHPRPDAEFPAVGFEVGVYDRTRPLVIDPVVLVFCGYIGGTKDDAATGVAVDASGDVYVAGSTTSLETSFPLKVGPYSVPNRFQNGFITKVDASGTRLIYSGYVPGGPCTALAVDERGYAYLTGNANDSLPVKVGPDLHYSGSADGYVARLHASGTLFDYCGYIGGNSDDSCKAIAIDPAGNAVVGGATNSDEGSFPVKRGPSIRMQGNGFIAKVRASGKSLEYCGYVTGSANVSAVALDPNGHAYLAGSAGSEMPVKVGPDLTANGAWDGFVGKLARDGSGYIYLGFIGGKGWDSIAGATLDERGNLFVTGDTQSDETSFPVKVGPDLTANGRADAFVAKVSPTGASLVFCGFIGGDADDAGRAITLDRQGNVCVGGWTKSRETRFPIKHGPGLKWSPSFSGEPDAFVAKVREDGSTLAYCGYIGGGDRDSADAVAVDRSGHLLVAGVTESDEQTFPVRAGPDLTYNGGSYSGDAFVAKVEATLVEARGPGRPGGTVTLELVASGDPGRPYQAAASLGTGPIVIDKRMVNLSPDWLLVISLAGVWPSVFQDFRGVIGADGAAGAAVHIPDVQALIGLEIHTAFVTLEPGAPSGVRAISNTASFEITK